ncbi:T9SS type A sorting domain-containing protein [Winogradskyella sp. UBA3174]|uniref:T9SS type A sorting domain-containing protein n=1 Tax=Winogradskyella sp. UBA3174 TaxID=1947785 RepID=UPI0025DDB90A|nr:T9SS type A sorting domain-containing protein [Winogradskyella sp. UBA3174]|tara:strand:- start:12123 stop:12719 length:597 start_codon:yes stop_codon:yes gene_type:complete
MKSKLLIIALALGLLSTNAQTTHNLNWERNVTGTGTADLTIETGDTVIWTWLDANHTVENVAGSSVETFTSGFLGPVGSTYSYTFTVVGDNDYFCGVHGAGSMSGKITVENNLGVEDETRNAFRIHTNPVNEVLDITFSKNLTNGELVIIDLLGKIIMTNKLTDTNSASIDVSLLNSGLYIVQVNSEDKTQVKRFIKQ